MFKRTIAALTILAAMLCFAVKVDAADAPRHTKDDTWLIYWYVSGTDLESNGHMATRDIAEMQHVKLPPNIKVLIATGGAEQWHHPTIAAGGDGIYLYSTNHLEKQIGWHANMGSPNTLASFLKFGEENFAADHRIIIFADHGGVSGVCYDYTTEKHDGLTYDELNEALAAVYGNSPEELPFELIGFDACLTGSYELANSIADFSRYMTGSEPSEYGWDYRSWIATLANDPSMNGAQIAKAICDSALKSYDEVTKRTNGFSVIDLTKMPELRTAYEAYFKEALKRSNKEVGFSGAFARAAENRNVDKYSNVYTDLGLLAKNTTSIMPDTSSKLLKAIDKAVIYNKRGSYLKGKGISTYYPYTSSEKLFEVDESGGNNYFDLISAQNSNYSAQKSLYSNLLELDLSNVQSNVPVERNSNGNLVAKLTPEQLENISSIQCVLFPVNEGGNYDLGGAILVSADDLKIDWKKGTVTEKFRAVEPMFDGHKIALFPSVGGRGHTFYTVPIIYNDKPRELRVRYDTSAHKYEIVGFGSMIENGMVRNIDDPPRSGAIITPIYVTIEESSVASNGETILATVKDLNSGQSLDIKLKRGEPFVYTRNSTITNKPIIKGTYFYSFMFSAPNGENVSSYPGVIVVKDGKIFRLTTEEFAKAVADVQ